MRRGHPGRRIGAAIALLAGACTSTDNRALLDELERAAATAPNPELDARVKKPGPYRIVGVDANSITLPMDSGKVPVVQGSINGVAMPFLLDTGTTHIVMSAIAARDARVYLPAGPAAELIAPGYRARYRVGAPNSITLGGSTLAGGVVAVPEQRSNIARRLGVRQSLHATVGSAVLSNYRVTFDFDSREVVLEPHGGEPVAQVLWVRVEINGAACRMLVDSGANGLFLEPAFARELGLIDDEEQQRHVEKADAAHDARMTTVRVDRLRCAGHTFEGLKAHVVRVADNDAKHDGLPYGGLLGLPGLGRHRWIVDYGRRRLVLDAAR